ncbi:MAG TPA: hypothetical protein ENI62_12295 [Gammaproteobacteria bacterium]|nr:hypothetical protein [Gammaproteobacteria bacterium]
MGLLFYPGVSHVCSTKENLDHDLNKDWALYGNVRYMSIKTDAILNGGPEFEVEIDPWVYSIGIGTPF